MRWYLSAVLACAAHVSATSRPAEQVCHPLITVHSTATFIKTPAAVTATVKTTETFYTKITKYRAGHTLSILVNATSTYLHTCIPASRPHVSLERRDGKDDPDSPTISAEETVLATEAPFFNMSSLLLASTADAENMSSPPPTAQTSKWSASVEPMQSLSTQAITSYVVSHKTHLASTRDTTVHGATEIITVSKFSVPPARTSKYRPETRLRPSKTTKTQVQDQSFHHGHDRLRTEASLTPIRSHSRDTGRKTTEVVASYSATPSSYELSATRRQKSYTVVEYNIVVEAETTTRQYSRKAKLTTSMLPVSTRKAAHPHKCDPTFTARYTVILTANRPTVTRTVTYAKLKTSTVRATKAASTKKITKTSIVATSSATIIAGRSGRYTARSGAKATFNVYKNVSFPESSLADCICDGETSCSSIGRGKTCDGLETCMDLCAGWNSDPKGPSCMGVSFVRHKTRSDGIEPPWCHLKWIVPPHSIPPQNATCGLVAEDVDSAVLYRQTFS